jgi:hypothetical protein
MYVHPYLRSTLRITTALLRQRLRGHCPPVLNITSFMDWFAHCLAARRLKGINPEKPFSIHESHAGPAILWFACLDPSSTTSVCLRPSATDRCGISGAGVWRNATREELSSQSCASVVRLAHPRLYPSSIFWGDAEGRVRGKGAREGCESDWPANHGLLVAWFPCLSGLNSASHHSSQFR